MTTVAISSLSPDAARALTDRIRESAENLWSLLLEAHQGCAWQALGYDSWAGYVAGEFDFGRQHSYKLLDQGRVIRALGEAAGVEPSIVSHDATHEEVQRLKPRLSEVTAEVREAVAGGTEPVEAVRSVIKRYGTPTPAVADALAKEHHLRVDGTDGYVHDGKERDEEVIGQELDNTFSVFRALEAMAQHPWTPAEFIGHIPDYQHYRITDYLDGAYTWFEELREAWRAKHGTNANRHGK
jgi:hypothetical protein